MGLKGIYQVSSPSGNRLSRWRTSGLRTAILIGGAVSYAIWLGCTFYLDTPLMASILLAPLTVIGELPRTNVIDDNATMLLIPLAGILILEPFVGLL